MKTQKIEYTSGNTKHIGHLAWDETQNGPRPGIVVFPEAFGLNDHTRERAEQLARLGFVALAADILGDGNVFDDVADLGPVLQLLYTDRAEWRSRARAALDTLAAQPQVDGSQIAAVGFCFGGATCFELARTGVALSALVAFHAGIVPELPDDSGRIDTKVLILHGADDPVATRASIEVIADELRRDKIDWQLIYYGNAAHSFTDPDADKRGFPGIAYNKTAEERSWIAMQTLFAEVFS